MGKPYDDEYDWRGGDYDKRRARIAVWTMALLTAALLLVVLAFTL